MRKIFLFLSVLLAFNASAQTDTLVKEYDTVVITALGRQSSKNIPYSIQQVNVKALQLTPRPQLMQQLTRLPSVSAITSGSGINKPVIRGLSFNHIQLFANGTRSDNQTWDDRHDAGISETGINRVEIINGPAALLYGPNAMGGAIIFSETPPAPGEKTNGYAQLGFFGNSIGANIDAGIRAAKKEFYYSVNTSIQSHTNYLQGGGKTKDATTGEDSKPIAFNSKFTDFTAKGMLGVRKEKREHRLNVNYYRQMLGIIEDESLEAISNPGKKEERDYEMEAPYQDVATLLISTENNFKIGTTALIVNGGYQFNKRREFEPGATLKSKYLGVGLDLSTVSGDVQWHGGKTNAAGITLGVQGFHQNNKNVGNWVLVPDARVSTIGGYILAHLNLPQWNFLLGIRADQHQLKMFTTLPKIADTLNPAVPKPAQQLSRKYNPASFSVGIVYHANERFSIKGNLANGFSAPNYAQLTAFGRHEGTYRFEVGDNSLDMERNTELDLAVQWDGENVGLSVNSYMNMIKDYIFINPTADSVKQYRIYRWTQHDATISGLELNFVLHPEQAKWFDGAIRAGLIRGQLTNDAGDLPYIPANKVITEVSFRKDQYKAWKKLYATLEIAAYGAQKKTAQFESATSGYVLTDVYLGGLTPIGKRQRWNAVIFCTNLFNTNYVNHLSLIKSINVADPGRNLGFRLRYQF